jgi:hypothetical protein
MVSNIFGLIRNSQVSSSGLSSIVTGSSISVASVGTIGRAVEAAASCIGGRISVLGVPFFSNGIQGQLRIPPQMTRSWPSKHFTYP